MMDNHALHGLVGRSPWTERTLRQILQASRYRYPILISGDEGTGKRLIAEAIHAHSHHDHPFIPFRCGRLPAQIEAQQLFGHPRGESRLAIGSARGAWGTARGGTLFLEDIDRLDRASQDRLFAMLDANRAAAAESHVRIAIATTCDLKQASQRGEFRFELLYALNTIRIRTEPLVDRVDDILPLARHIIARVTLSHGLAFRPLTATAAALLESYPWPGNVNELERVIESAVLASPDSQELDLFDFPRLLDAIDSGVPDRGTNHDEARPVNQLEAVPELPIVVSKWPSMRQVEADHIADTLRHAGYRLTVAARLLELDVQQLRTMIKQLRVRLPVIKYDTSSFLESPSERSNR